MESKMLGIFILLYSTCQLQAKSVGEKGKQRNYQDFEKSSPIQIIPQWYAISDQEGAVLPKSAPYTSIESKQIPNMHDTKPNLISSTRLNNLKGQEYDGKFDLLNHASLDQIFEPEYSDSSHSYRSKNKESSDSSSEVMFKTKHKPPFFNDPFEDDEVFVENKQKVNVSPKISEIKPLHKLKEGEAPIIQTEDTTCRNPTPETLPLPYNIKSANAPNSNLPSQNFEIELEKPRSKLTPNEIAKEAKRHLNNLDDQSKITNPVNLHHSINQDMSSMLNKENDKMKFEQLDEKSSSSNIKEIPHLKNNVKKIFEVGFNPFVFNPQAEPQEKFQECETKQNESGHCRYVQHCMLPSLLSSIQQFMDNVCVIQEMFIGVCCPEFPVAILEVQWPKKSDNSSMIDSSPIKTPEDCGVGTNTRIVGGFNAHRKAWPWMVALLNEKKKFFCGGALINDRYVLTASHCTFGPPGNRILARLGVHDLNDTKHHDDYQVTEIKRHGQYTRITLRNDIALLKLEKPVKFTEFVKTICLPGSEQDYVGKTAFLAGWGHVDGDTQATTNILQESSFPIVNNTECSKTHGLPITPSVICAAALEKDTGACNGDSGGPLMLLDDDERWKVVGLVSWGRRGCSTKFPTVYTRVTHYLDWIKQHTT